MDKMVIGTRNPKKLKEIRALLDDLPLQVLNLSDVGCNQEVEEDGLTLEQNAAKKALVYAGITGLPTVADDSGLEVDALGGDPGVHSARYAGESQDDQRNIDKVLAKLKDVPWEKRTARFRTVVALALPDGQLPISASGSVDGYITTERAGTGGFGYDQVFYHDPSGCTFAQLSAEGKNAVSHRARALQEFADRLKAWLNG